MSIVTYKVLQVRSKSGKSSEFSHGSPTKFESSFSKFLPIFDKYPNFQKILKERVLKIGTSSSGF